MSSRFSPAPPSPAAEPQPPIGGCDRLIRSRATPPLSICQSRLPVSGMVGPASPELLGRTLNSKEKQQAKMTSTDRERWQRVKDQLRKQLGEDVFSSWFGRMELDAADNGTVRLSVPTRLLRTWIQAHYSEHVLAKWQAEDTTISRLELRVRSAAIRPPVVKPKPAEPAALSRDPRDMNGSESRASTPFMSVHEALGGSPLDPRLTFDTFIVGRSNTLAHAAAKQVATSRRG